MSMLPGIPPVSPLCCPCHSCYLSGHALTLFWCQKMMLSYRIIVTGILRRRPPGGQRVNDLVVQEGGHDGREEME